MNHFKVSQWVDFARGFVVGPEGLAMENHLAEGCGECGESATFSKSLTDICRAITENAAPESVVRNAKAIFPVHVRAEAHRALRMPVQLIYDSFLVPAPAGLRASWQVGWQALYRSGDCSLDLRIEPELSSPRAALIGQVNNHTLPEHKMENIPVLVKSGRMVVAETRSNRFGEFQLEYEQQSRLQLCVYLEDGSKCFHVPLKKLASDRNAGTDRLGMEAGYSKSSQGQE